MYSIQEDEIIFDSNFDEPFSNDIIEILSTVKKITFGLKYNQPLANIPGNITHIAFTGDNPISINRFNQQIDKDCLPKSLTHLMLGYSFNQCVDNLPFGITHLRFGWEFNKPLNNLPNSITHLRFGWEFNQPVDFLPNSIRELFFYRSFNQSVDNLPEGITHLTFGLLFNQSINNLPLSLTYLKIGEEYVENRTISTFKQSICGLSRLTNLKYLKFGNGFLQDICCPIDGHCYLPNSIEELHFEYDNQKNMVSLPTSLRKLYIKNRLRSIRNMLGKKRKRSTF